MTVDFSIITGVQLGFEWVDDLEENRKYFILNMIVVSCLLSWEAE
jgi:hypothetical protein